MSLKTILLGAVSALHFPVLPLLKNADDRDREQRRHDPMQKLTDDIQQEKPRHRT